ncbi:type II secretion system protein GspF, partial [Patescibacteria group bacterium]|nr:type II secretion system protein GspF [Patescibacteria group bacterium]
MEYNYQARTKEGQLETGVVEAPDEGIALETLRSRGLIVVSLAPSTKFVLFRRIPF